LTTKLRWLIVILVFASHEIHANGNETSDPSAAPAPNPPRLFSRIRDRWVHRTRVQQLPSNPTTQPATSPPPVQDAPPSLPPLPDDLARQAQGAPAVRPAQAPGGAAGAQPRGPSSAPRAAPTTPAPTTTPTTIPATPAPAPTTTPATAPISARPAAPAGTDFATLAGPQPGSEVLAAPGAGQGQVVTSLGGESSYEPLTIIGDMSPLTVSEPVGAGLQRAHTAQFPPHPLPKPPSPRVASSLAPSTRTFKIADNQSPMPQDRVYLTFNYFNNLNAALNRRFESPVDELRAYRYIFGFEKTFDEGRGSIGVQLPLDNLTAESTIRGNFVRPGGTSTALDDLTVFSKYVLKYNPQTGSLISAGLAVTPRDGPETFAGAKYLVGVNDTTVQPFLGYLWRRNRFYLHGFVALDVPTSIRDVTMVYNDIGIGYYVYRNPNRDALLAALVPTFEVHVNDPLTHGDFDNQFDPTGTANVVNLTYGINAMIGRDSVFTFGWVTPVTGPRPFEYEIVALINWRFGRTRGMRAPLPMTGG
jgi:hypothetical protein